MFLVVLIVVNALKGSAAPALFLSSQAEVAHHTKEVSVEKPKRGRSYPTKEPWV